MNTSNDKRELSCLDCPMSGCPHPEVCIEERERYVKKYGLPSANGDMQIKRERLLERLRSEQARCLKGFDQASQGEHGGWWIAAMLAKDAADYIESIPSATTPRMEPCIAALRELVELKALHDAIETARKKGGDGEPLEAMEQDYQRRKPLAWRAARAAVESEPSAPSSTGDSAMQRIAGTSHHAGVVKNDGSGECHQPDECPVCIARRALASSPSSTRDSKWIDEVIREIQEMPDRTSPDDFPEAMLVTADELRRILQAHNALPSSTARRFPICKDHTDADWNQPKLDDQSCILCRLFYLEAQESLLEEWQQRALGAEEAIKDMERPLDAQMARLNATVARLNEENDKLRAAQSATQRSDPGTEKLLRDLLDRAYKMMLMAGYRVAEVNPDHDDPIIAWMSDARAMLYGRGRQPDPASLT